MKSFELRRGFRFVPVEQNVFNHFLPQTTVTQGGTHVHTRSCRYMFTYSPSLTPSLNHSIIHSPIKRECVCVSGMAEYSPSYYLSGHM